MTTCKQTTASTLPHSTLAGDVMRSARLLPRRATYADIAAEARHHERAGVFGLAAERWLQARILARSPENRQWADSRQQHCLYMCNLMASVDSFGRGVPKCCLPEPRKATKTETTK